MRSENLYILLTALAWMLSSCYFEETDPIPLKKVSYTIYDEPPESRKLVVEKITPLKDSNIYYAFDILNWGGYMNGYYGRMLLFKMYDRNNAQDYHLQMHTRDGLSYGNYTTTDGNPGPGKIVMADFIKVNTDNGTHEQLVISDPHIASNVFRFEKFDNVYDLLTIDIAVTEKNNVFKGRFRGKFKLKR